MYYVGINGANHDASITVFDPVKNRIEFASHAERYSRLKNDSSVVSLRDVTNCFDVEKVFWYENPLLKNIRQFTSGQHNYYSSKKEVKKLLDYSGTIYTSKHHESHAAAGFYTSDFSEAVIIIIDAIGEFDTTTIYKKTNTMEKIYSKKYPDSIGLFYSAFTQFLGLKPNEEEYILMGMAAYGNSDKYYEKIKRTFFDKDNVLKYNLHKGLQHIFVLPLENIQDKYDIASAVQKITEEYILTLCSLAKKLYPSNNLVLGGGVALNCVANSKILKSGLFENVHIYPNPGDSGNSLGCILNHTKKHIEHKDMFLGYDIPPKNFDYKNALADLLDGKIIGIASGKAEFGPRAFGNRSLLCDPRLPNGKDMMNTIKKRQLFRPFAPIVLEEYYTNYFDMDRPSPYMQFVFQVNDPKKYPVISHVDNSARVQTITQDSSSVTRKLLEMFYEKTGCAILVNTSLNIKGQPLVNTLEDAKLFSQFYNVPVYS